MPETFLDSKDTSRLLEQLRKGRTEAFDLLLARHHNYLRQLVDLQLDRQLRSRVDVSDVIQETQLEVVRRLESYLREPPLPFRLWLRKLACDCVRSLRRHHLETGKRNIFRELALPEKSSLLLAERLLARGASPSEQLDKKEKIKRVQLAISALPEGDREVLLMRTFEGLSFDEIACLLNIEPAAARKRHGRALLRLHKLLTEGGLTESQS